MIDSAHGQPFALWGRGQAEPPQPLSERGQVCDYVACPGMVERKGTGKKS